jgi:diacylglycerol kinase (ATP)
MTEPRFSSQRLSDLPRSFGYAGAGLRYLVRSQRNARIHLVLSLVAIGLALWLGLGPVEWAVLVLTIGFVLASEAFNTAVEATVDRIGPEAHWLAKIAKDTAAAGVLIAALTAIGVAVCLFGPRLLARW